MNKYRCRLVCHSILCHLNFKFMSWLIFSKFCLSRRVFRSNINELGFRLRRGPHCEWVSCGLIFSSHLPYEDTKPWWLQIKKYLSLSMEVFMINNLFLSITTFCQWTSSGMRISQCSRVSCPPSLGSFIKKFSFMTNRLNAKTVRMLSKVHQFSVKRQQLFEVFFTRWLIKSVLSEWQSTSTK